MSYLMKAMWTEEREVYFDSLDEAVDEVRKLEAAHGIVSAYVEGHGVTVGVSPLPKKVKA